MKIFLLSSFLFFSPELWAQFQCRDLFGFGPSMMELSTERMLEINRSGTNVLDYVAVTLRGPKDASWVSEQGRAIEGRVLVTQEPINLGSNETILRLAFVPKAQLGFSGQKLLMYSLSNQTTYFQWPSYLMMDAIHSNDQSPTLATLMNEPISYFVRFAVETSAASEAQHFFLGFRYDNSLHRIYVLSRKTGQLQTIEMVP